MLLQPEFSGLFRRKKKEEPIEPVETAEGPDGRCIERDDAVDGRAAHIYCFQNFNLSQPGFSEQLLQPFEQITEAAKRVKLSARLVADCQKGLFKLTQSAAPALHQKQHLFNGGPTEERPSLPWVFPLSDCDIQGELDVFQSPDYPIRAFQYRKRGPYQSLTITWRVPNQLPSDPSAPAGARPAFQDTELGFASNIKANPRTLCQTDFMINTILAYSRLNHYLLQQIEANRIPLKPSSPRLPQPPIRSQDSASGTHSTGPK